MKRLSVLLLVLMPLLTSCLGSTRLLINRGEMKEKYKTVLVVPLYIENPVIAKENKEHDVFNIYPKGYNAQLGSLLKKYKSAIDKEVKLILATGDFKFKLLEYKGNIRNKLQVEKWDAQFNRIKWKSNHNYYLNPEDIKKIANEYKADAVLFHQLVHMKYYTKVSSDYMGPRDGLAYITTMYSKEGKKLFTNDAKKCNLIYVYFQDYKEKGFIFKKLQTRPAPLNKIKEAFSPKEIKYILRNDINRDRGYYQPFLSTEEEI